MSTMMIPTFRGLSPVDRDEANEFSGMTDLLMGVSARFPEITAQSARGKTRTFRGDSSWNAFLDFRGSAGTTP